jgi:hypothetical protein
MCAVFVIVFSSSLLVHWVLYVFDYDMGVVRHVAGYMLYAVRPV